MTATTQTIKAVIDAVVAALEANSDVTDIAGAGTDSIFIYHDEEKLDDAMQANPEAISPALIVFSRNELWIVAGNTRDRNMTFFIDIQVWDPDSFGARLDASNNLVEKIYETLVGSKLGLTNPQPTQIEPVRYEYVGELVDEDGETINASIWRVTFTITTDWHP